jgi:hypothetical protein
MPRAQSDLANIMLVVLISFVILFLGITIANPLAEQTGEEATSDTVLLGDAGEWVTIADTIGTDPTAYDSRGYAVAMTGANDSYVRSTSSVALASDETWTVAAWGAVDENASSDRMALISADGRVIIEYDDANGNWSAWYYDDGSTDSYRVNVSAPDQPGNLTHVAVRSNGTHMTIYANATAGETVDVTTANIANAPVESDNWHGRLDEARTFDDALSEATIGELHSDGVGAQPGTNRTSRAMFDEPDRDQQRLFFSGASLETSNVTYTTGLPGNELDGATITNDLTGATDYEWDTQGPRIKPVDGGRLDGAPVVYVDWATKGATGTFARDFTEAVELAGVALLVAILATVVGILQATRRRR